MGNIARVIIRTPNWIGDTLMSLPLVSILARSFPNARIDLLAPSRVAGILKTHPHIHRIHCYDGKDLDSFLSRLKFWRKLRQEKYDLGITLPNSFRSAWQLCLAGASERVGYNTDARGILLTRSLSKNRETENQTAYYLRILTTLGIVLPQPPPQPDIYLTDQEKDWGEDSVKGLAGGNSLRVVVIAPTASKPERSWHAHRFACLARRLIKELSAVIVLTGAPRETPLLEQIRQDIGVPEKVRVIDLEVRKTAALIRKCSLFVGNDSGLSHIAAALGCPLIVIFGPGNPEITGARSFDGKHHLFIYHREPCSPCRERFFKDCRPSKSNKPACLESITVEEVFEAALTFLLP